MKILKTDDFVSERIQLQPITNAQLDKTAEKIKNNIVLDEGVKRLIFDFDEKYVFEERDIDKQDFDKELEKFCHEFDNISKRKGRERFIEQVHKNNMMVYVKCYEPKFPESTTREALVTISNNPRLKNNIHVLYGVEGRIHMSGDYWIDGYVFMETFSYHPDKQ